MIFISKEKSLHIPEFSTEDKLEYQFHPAAGGIVRFKVRAEHDAHLALTTGPGESDPMIEVFLGGWKNTKSVIRKNRTKPDVVEVDTPDILNAGEFRGFWIRWTHDGIITVGREDEVAAFMSWEDPDQVNFQFVGVCTGWGATGCWKIEGTVLCLQLTEDHLVTLIPNHLPSHMSTAHEASHFP